ncbi:MAG: hypothetical protein A3H27_17020 [Acidobacteria bacterium RIFCSPLOWO2_02_FULL_59_13]|nr:MAG: hypothetical protein A3H27_17020 [Acidobacteria bacterium RIFCSPLOWO2_02_FULL_59_13]
MKLGELVKAASNKTLFTELQHYVDFCQEFLAFIARPGAIQAEIVSRNENHYRFLQFKNAEFSISRPLNSNLLYTSKVAKDRLPQFLKVIADVKAMDTPANREVVNRSIYTIQQSIGACLDALPAGQSNTARKINGDLFERLIRILLIRMGIECTSGVVKVPIKVDGVEEFSMSYQHDLIIKSGTFVKIIGSVKTSSKDRLDKIFVDKFLLGKLTGKDIPHVAIFLNDVQRKGKNPKEYGVNATFLPGHFKGYTVKLNPLDGVYYFDIRPHMLTEPILKKHIRTFDHFLFKELWSLLARKEAVVATVEAK